MISQINGIAVPALVNQIDDQTCVHACLAMVTGQPIERVISVVGGDPPSDDDVTLFLALHGIVSVPVLLSSPAYPFGIYLASAPSLNVAPKMHRFVVYTALDGSSWVVLDPQRGRPGRKFYKHFGGDMAYTDLRLLGRAKCDVAAWARALHGEAAQ